MKLERTRLVPSYIPFFLLSRHNATLWCFFSLFANHPSSGIKKKIYGKIVYTTRDMAKVSASLLFFSWIINFLFRCFQPHASSESICTHRNFCCHCCCVIRQSYEHISQCSRVWKANKFFIFCCCCYSVWFYCRCCRRHVHVHHCSWHEATHFSARKTLCPTFSIEKISWKRRVLYKAIYLIFPFLTFLLIISIHFVYHTNAHSVSAAKATWKIHAIMAAVKQSRDMHHYCSPVAMTSAKSPWSTTKWRWLSIAPKRRPH